MPSLRRTLSSPSARTSPYHHHSSHSNGNVTRAGGNTPRRSSGSDTSRRRVLADIDWWRVQDGQRDQSSSEEEQDAPADNQADDLAGPRVENTNAGVSALNDGTVPPAWQPVAGAGIGALGATLNAEPLFMDMMMHVPDLSEALSPIPQFADLSISPRTPSRPRYTHSSQSSESSLASTPEVLYNALFPAPTLERSLTDMFSFNDTYSLDSLSGAFAMPRAVPFGTRSVSYSSVEPQLSSNRRRRQERRFDDIVPPPFFSLTREDVDDLFD
ncbi:predicted protein [Sparassis crispa]|uniref:Uncharacterized protein n=1 Tax=Sparassis crispa TaxID=139825 RepID=A0A401GIY5_9APHY|nr:predicted protein [Sparassis crispa]GBE82118.1 predicted protein [Sparassis crispa]